MAHSGEYVLHSLVRNDDNLDLLQDHLSKGMDPNRPQPYVFCPYGPIVIGETPLHVAAKSSESNLEAVKELIKAGADINLWNSFGFTPLHLAVNFKNGDLVDFLIQSGAFINIGNVYGNTALHSAVFAYEDNLVSVWMIKKLLQHKDIFVDAKNNKGYTPLMMALEYHNFEAAEILLHNGANPNIANDAMQTPLHASLSSTDTNHFIVVQLLMQGADIYAMNGANQTPIDILLNNVRDSVSLRFAKSILKIIALRYEIREYLICKIKMVPELQQFLDKCCEETEEMKKCLITENLTLHDFATDCFQEDNFSNPVSQIYKPVVEKLFQGFYFQYFDHLFDRLSDSDLIDVLIITVDLTKDFKKYCEKGSFIHMLSNINVHLIVKFLSRSEIFYLIGAVCNVKISESMQHLCECHKFWLKKI